MTINCRGTVSHKVRENGPKQEVTKVLMPCDKCEIHEFNYEIGVESNRIERISN